MDGGKGMREVAGEGNWLVQGQGFFGGTGEEGVFVALLSGWKSRAPTRGGGFG